MKSFDSWLNSATPPVERPRLTPEAQLEREDFNAVYDLYDGCSCHLSAPCGWCTHPGNPMNQNEPECWVNGVVGEAWSEDFPSIPPYEP